MLDALGSGLMRLVYFFILTPVACLMRLLKYDPLKLHPAQSSSRWSSRKRSRFDKKFFHKQG